MKSIVIGLGLLGLLLAPLAFAAGNTDAGVMKFKVYKFAVSTSAACTSPIEIFNSDTGVEQNMLTGPTFGSGRLTPGTYPCVMIEMSKIIKTAAATATGTCTTTEFSDVICNDTPQLSKTIAGADVSCTGGITNDQHVTLFITTVSAGASGNRALLPPTSATDTTSGLKLTSAFVVTTTDTSGTLSVNYRNFLSNGGPTCSTNAPTFSFQ